MPTKKKGAKRRYAYGTADYEAARGKNLTEAQKRKHEMRLKVARKRSKARSGDVTHITPTKRRSRKGSAGSSAGKRVRRSR